MFTASLSTGCRQQRHQQQQKLNVTFASKAYRHDDIGQRAGVIDRGAVSVQHAIHGVGVFPLASFLFSPFWLKPMSIRPSDKILITSTLRLRRYGCLFQSPSCLHSPAHRVSAVGLKGSNRAWNLRTVHCWILPRQGGSPKAE